jgi:hypothetical protein
MKMKKSARLAGMLTPGWAVSIVMQLFIAAIVSLSALWAALLVGVVFEIKLPYKTITALTTIVVLAVLIVFEAIKKNRAR